MNVYLRARTKTALLFIIVFSGIVSCKKDYRVGVGLQPKADGIFVFATDTLTLLTKTIREDSVRTDRLSYNALGSYVDPIFGKQQALIYSQINLLRNNISFGGATKLDSAVLCLNIIGPSQLYGNASSPQTFKVYELDQAMSPDSNYYTNALINYKLPEVGSWTGVPNPNDTVTELLGSKTFKNLPQLRIKLSPAFANKLFTAPASALSDDAAFTSFLKGIAIIPDNPTQTAGQGALWYLNLRSQYSNLSVYYNDSMRLDFIISGNSARINSYLHDYTGTEPQKQVQAPATSSFDTSYVQTMGGMKTFISLPTLFDLVKTKKVAINSAQLTLRPLGGSVSTLTPVPSRLLLVQPDSQLKNDFIKDQVFEQAIYGGSYSSSGGTYTFNLARHLQEVLDAYIKSGSNINRGLYVLIPSDNPYSTSRLVLDTRKGIVDQGIKLNVVYTVIDK